MPRFEPAINQFIAPEDHCTMTAAPFKSTRSHQRKKSNSISALERLVVFTEATQRVKRRLRNVIAGAVGASTSRPKRKSRDIMHVDDVWNGWFEPCIGPVDTLPEPVPRQTALPNFMPTINRYSVNMDAKSISDVSMDLGESDDEGASTPRANSPEPGTPVAVPAKEIKSKKAEETEDEEDGDQHEGEEDEGDDHENDDNHNSDHEEEEEKPAPKPNKVDVGVPSKPDDDATFMIFSPMDEDPAESASTPRAAPPAPLPSKVSPTRSSKRHTSAVEEHADDKTPPLTSRTSSTESTPPKTPKLTLQTNFSRTPIKGDSHFLSGMVDVFTTSPLGLGLDLEAETHLFKGLDLMDVIPSSAVSQEEEPPTYAIERETRGSHRSEAEEVKEAPQKPTLIPAAKIVEKKTSHKSSRRGSRASETANVVCSPRRATTPAGKKNSKGSLNDADAVQELVSPTTYLRNRIDSLPLEQEDIVPAWGEVWALQTSIPFFEQNNSEYCVLPIQIMRTAGNLQ